MNALIPVIIQAFTTSNLFKSKTTALAAITAGAGAITVTQYSSEHDMWVGLVAAVVSAVLFFIKDKAKD